MKVPPHDKPPARDLPGRKNPGGWLPLGEKPQQTEQNIAFIQGFLEGGGARSFPGQLGIGGFLWPDSGTSSEIGGISSPLFWSWSQGRVRFFWVVEAGRKVIEFI